MRSEFSYLALKRVLCIALSLSLLALPARGQSNLSGVIDIHAHTDPDSMPRSIDAIDLARLAKQRGMRGLVLKNHYESTAALAYIVRKEVPGIEIFGGIDLNRTVGGVNPAAVERMVLMKGAWGKVVWMPTFDSENQVRVTKENRPFVSVAKNGHLLPEVEQVLDIVAKNQLLLETGHSSAEEGLLIVREAKRRGVQHIVVTHAMASVVRMTIPQMREAAGDGEEEGVDHAHQGRQHERERELGGDPGLGAAHRGVAGDDRDVAPRQAEAQQQQQGHQKQEQRPRQGVRELQAEDGRRPLQGAPLHAACPCPMRSR